MESVNRFSYQQLLIGEALKTAAHLEPDRDAFVFEDQRLTYKTLTKRAEQISGWLKEEAVEKGEKVGCIFKNGLTFVELYFGVSFNGSVFVPVNFRLAPSEMEYIINDADVKILFIEEDYIETIQSILPQLEKVEKIVVVQNNETSKEVPFVLYESIFNPSVTFQRAELQDDDDHLIIYTSALFIL